MDDEEITEVTMPNFDEIEENVVIELNVKEVYEAPKKRGRKPKQEGDKQEVTPEQKAEKMAAYYEANKEHRLQYKQAKRGAGQVEQDICELKVERIPQYLENGGKKKTTNLDWIRYGGAKRTLTINQPSEKLLNILRAMEYQISESA